MLLSQVEPPGTEHSEYGSLAQGRFFDKSRSGAEGKTSETHRHCTMLEVQQNARGFSYTRSAALSRMLRLSACKIWWIEKNRVYFLQETILQHCREDVRKQRCGAHTDFDRTSMHGLKQPNQAASPKRLQNPKYKRFLKPRSQ